MLGNNICEVTALKRSLAPRTPLMPAQSKLALFDCIASKLQLRFYRPLPDFALT